MKTKLLILPLLLATNAQASDALLPSDDSVYYSDKRVRYTSKLGEIETAEEKVARFKRERELAKKQAEIEAKQSAIEAEREAKMHVAEAEQRRLKMPLRELNETISISFRDKSLPSSIRSVTPPGWVVDLQIDESLFKTQVSFSGETTYLQALRDILEPQGLTFLAYRNMKPKPLIVVTHGGSK